MSWALLRRGRMSNSGVTMQRDVSLGMRTRWSMDIAVARYQTAESVENLVELIVVPCALRLALVLARVIPLLFAGTERVVNSSCPDAVRNDAAVSVGNSLKHFAENYVG